MKKSTTILLSILMCTICLFAFIACGTGGLTNSTQPSDYVKFGKKYYHLDSNNYLSGYKGIDKNEYLVINKDGTAILYQDLITYVKENTVSHNVTTNYFKWTYAEEGVLLLVNNGVSSEHTSPEVESNMMLACTKEVIVENGVHFWICEDYLDQLPNNGKLV